MFCDMKLCDLAVFRHAWRIAARRGWADTIDGVQYYRVLFEWWDAGMPERVLSFIRDDEKRIQERFREMRAKGE